MRYVKLGRTGLDVSRICLGCMSYGSPRRGTHPWTLDTDEARPFIRQALEAGINFFDTANVYSLGTSEEILGAVLAEHANRDDVVIATKVHGAVGTRRRGPIGQGALHRGVVDVRLAVRQGALHR
jgi:aryl-alcohol dehydrogenase-like predicted oxidoreductase